MEPLTDNSIDTHIEHEQGEGAPLSDTPKGRKRTPIAPSSAKNHFCILPERVLQSQQFGPHPVGCLDFEHVPPVDRVLCLLEIQIDLVEGALITPRQLLGQYRLNRGRPRTLLWKAAVEAIVGLDCS